MIFDGGQNCSSDAPVCVSLNLFSSVLSDEVDEIEVYGSEAQSGTQLATYSFEVKTKIHPIWPECFFMSLGRFTEAS